MDIFIFLSPSPLEKGFIVLSLSISRTLTSKGKQNAEYNAANESY